MTTVTARMAVVDVQTGPESRSIRLHAVYSDDPKSPNYSFSRATPHAELSMTISNPDAWPLFEQGATLDVTFTKSAE